MEEETTNPQSFLEQVRQEREALEKANSEMKQLLQEQRELRAVEILSGKTDAGKKTEPKKEEVSAVDYALNAKKGIITK